MEYFFFIFSPDSIDLLFPGSCCTLIFKKKKRQEDLENRKKEKILCIIFFKHFAFSCTFVPFIFIFIPLDPVKWDRKDLRNNKSIKSGLILWVCDVVFTAFGMHEMPLSIKFKMSVTWCDISTFSRLLLGELEKVQWVEEESHNYSPQHDALSQHGADYKKWQAYIYATLNRWCKDPDFVNVSHDDWPLMARVWHTFTQ